MKKNIIIAIAAAFLISGCKKIFEPAIENNRQLEENAYIPSDARFPFGILLKLWQTSPLNFVVFGWFYGWGMLALLVGVVKNTMVTSSTR